MQRIRHLLVALVVLVPLLTAAGFIRMAVEVCAMGSAVPASSNVVIAQVTLAAWKDDVTMAYLRAVLAALALGRVHALLQRRWS
jgi:adenylate cyclase